MPATRRTRGRALAEQAAGQPVSPFQALPTTTRSTKIVKSKKRSKIPSEEPPSETDTFPHAVISTSESQTEIPSELLSKDTSEVPSKLSSEVAPEVSSELDSEIPQEADPEVSSKVASDVASDIPPSFACNHSTIVNSPAAPSTKHSVVTVSPLRQPHALVHIWLEPSPADIEAEYPRSKASVTLSVPLPVINDFIKWNNQVPQSSAEAPAGSTNSGPLIAIPASRLCENQQMTLAKTAKLMVNDVATQTLPSKSPPKRKVDEEDVIDQPSAKRSKTSGLSAAIRQPPMKYPRNSRLRPIRKVRAKIDEATGRVEGTAYTVEGQLVLDPYQSDVVIENSDDEGIPFDSERVGFFDVPDAIRKRFTKKAKPDQSKPEENTIPTETAKEPENIQATAVVSDRMDLVSNPRDVPEVENQSLTVVQNEVNGQSSAVIQPAPTTPGPVRDSMLSNFTRSVSKFMPHIPSFGRRGSAVVPRQDVDAAPTSSPTTQVVGTDSRNVNANRTSTHGSTHESAHGSTQPEELSPIPEYSQVQARSPRQPQTEPRQSKPFIFRRNKPAAPVSTGKPTKAWKTYAKIRAEQEEERRKMVLAHNKRLIEDEVIRKVKAAMDESERQLKADGANQPGQKRKRYSPDVIPNPVGCSYGMDIDFFVVSSDDEEVEKQPTPTKPSKRVRFNIDAPSTPPRQVMGDPSQATPYTGVLFADPKPNVFDAVDAVNTVNNTPSITFSVPLGSDSEGEEDGLPGSAASTEPAIGESSGSVTESASSVQSPAPVPSPSHAALPQPDVASIAPNAIAESNATAEPNAVAEPDATTESDATSFDPLDKVRSQAMRYTPRQPSGLRASSRLSGSTVASDIENEPNSDGVQGTLVMDQNQPESVIAQEQTNKKREDDEVQAALDLIREEDLIQFVFPKPRTYADAGIVDPEVQASLDSIWTAEDDENAVRAFEADFSAWKAQRSSEDPSTRDT